MRFAHAGSDCLRCRDTTQDLISWSTVSSCHCAPDTVGRPWHRSSEVGPSRHSKARGTLLADLYSRTCVPAAGAPAIAANIARGCRFLQLQLRDTTHLIGEPTAFLHSTHSVGEKQGRSASQHWMRTVEQHSVPLFLSSNAWRRQIRGNRFETTGRVQPVRLRLVLCSDKGVMSGVCLDVAK